MVFHAFPGHQPGMNSGVLWILSFTNYAEFKVFQSSIPESTPHTLTPAQSTFFSVASFFVLVHWATGH